MKKQVLFTLLFLSWLVGLSLICRFPPIPDYQISSQNSGAVCQDAFPELHQRNTSLSGDSHFFLGMELLGSLADFQFDFKVKESYLVENKLNLNPTASFFNTIQLLEAFFETW
jgi:hypothetical protein